MLGEKFLTRGSGNTALEKTGSAPRIMFIDGPGDTISSFQRWRSGEDHPGETAVTYSGQFFDVCERLGARVLAISCSTKPGYLEDGNFVVEHRARPWPEAKGALFHLGQALWAADLSRSALRFRPDVIVLGDSPYPFLFAPLRPLGMQLMPALHCCLWPQGYPPRGVVSKRVSLANGWFFRKVADATLAISPECERQVHGLARSPKGPVLPYRAKYRQRIAQPPAAPPGKPFRVMFAGRCEREKGVFDIVAIAARLQLKRPGDFHWTLCGGGSSEAELRREIEAKGLSHCVLLRGQLQRSELTAEYGKCDAVFVPTTSEFTEGLNKVTLEGMLAGRPVVASTTTHAGELLGDAGLVVGAEDLDGFQRALERLADDPALYLKCCQGTLGAGAALVNSSIAFEAVLESALRTLLGARSSQQHPQASGGNSEPLIGNG